MAQLSSVSILSVRVNPGERALLEQAAEQAHTSLSDFIRRKALEAAETDILGRSIVTIPAHDWEAFEGWLAKPGTKVSALEELARRAPTWER